MNLPAKNKINTYTMTLIALSTSILCILSPFSIPIPFSPVPITFATFAIYLISYLLGFKKGVLSVVLYLVIGLAGVPVFSNFSSGFGKLLGPTGGFLIGYIFMALICGFFIEKFPSSIPLQIIGMIVGSVMNYAFGSLWLGYQNNLSIAQALWIGAVPYLPGDAVKIIVTSIIGPVIRKRLFRSGLIE